MRLRDMLQLMNEIDWGAHRQAKTEEELVWTTCDEALRRLASPITFHHKVSANKHQLCWTNESARLARTIVMFLAKNLIALPIFEPLDTRLLPWPHMTV